MIRPGGAAAAVLVAEEARRRAVAPSATILALCATVLLVLSTGFYNNAAAPPQTLKHFVELIPLGEGNSATPSDRIEIQSARPVVGSHYLLDPEVALLRPINNGPAVPLGVSGVREAVSDGDNFAWVDPSSPARVTYYDQALGSQRSAQAPAGFEPLDGTLRAGGGVVGWSYLRPDGATAVAAFSKDNATLRTYSSPFLENRTLAAVLGPDFFYSKTLDRSDLWVYNSTLNHEELIATAPSVGRPSTGQFFVAWVNESHAMVEYYDVLDRVVREVPPPEGVTPTWVLANDLTLVFGGMKPGFLSSSPRVELYDFGTGSSFIYESISVDFDSSPFFGYADRVVASLVIEPQKRPNAPLTSLLLVATLGSLVATGLLAARDVTRGEDDL